MKVHVLLRAALASSVGLLNSCSAVRVDETQAASFDHYRHYSWVQPDIETNRNPLLNSPLTTARIEQAVDQAFSERGVTRDDQHPDFYLCYHEFVQNATRTVANPGFYGYQLYGAFWYGGRRIPMGYGYWHQPWNTGYHTEHYQDGTLILDVIDAKNNELLWRGSVEHPLSDPAALSKQFAREARSIVQHFPVTKHA